MTANAAERRVKGLQKELLARLEEHPALLGMEPNAFNELRRRVFRSTFEAYRLGIVGLDEANQLLLRVFTSWPQLHGYYLTTSSDNDLRELCFRASLEAFRLGALVAAERP